MTCQFRAALFVLVAAVLAGCAVPARDHASRPVALVIGNGAYKGEIPALPNPENDAETVAERMRANGFATVLLLDATREEMLRTLQAFGEMAHGAPLGVIYYSGHGVEIAGRNLLLPIDFQVGSGSETATLADRGVSLAEVGNLVSGRAGATLIILDACRTDPTLPTTAETSTRRLPSIAGMGVGLGGEELPSATVVYATEPGKTALDGNGEFSPFTTAVLQHVNTPMVADRYGDRYASFLPLLRLSVLDATGGAQTPTWRGPDIPAMRGIARGQGPVVQRIVTASHPDWDQSTSLGSLRSMPVLNSQAGASTCTSRSNYSGAVMLATLTTGQNSTVCGALFWKMMTAEVTEPPKHGRVVLYEGIYGYVPNAN